MNELIERFGKGKCFWLTWITLSAILIVIMIPLVFNHNSHNFMGTRLRLSSIESGTVYMVDSNGNYAVFTRTRATGGDVLTVYYLDKRISRGMVNHNTGWSVSTGNFSAEYTFSNGSVITASRGQRSLSSAELKRFEPTPLQIEEHRLLYRMDRVTRSHIPTDSAVALSLFGFGFLLLGVAQIMYPKELWEFRHMFSVRGGEPTELALAGSFIGGLLIIAMAYIFIPMMFLM